MAFYYFYIPITSQQEGKRENWMLCFKAQWSVDYTTTELDGKALCLLFNDIIAILTEYKDTLTLPD